MVGCKHNWVINYTNVHYSFTCTKCGKRARGVRTYRRKAKKQIAIISIVLSVAVLYVLVNGVPQLPQISLPNIIETKPSQTPSETPQGQSTPTPSSTSQIVFSNCIMASNGAGGIRINCENHDSVQCISDPPIGAGIQKDVTLTIDKNSCIIQFPNSQGSNTVYHFQLGTSPSVSSQNPTPTTQPSILPKVTFPKVAFPKISLPNVPVPNFTSVIPPATPPPSLDGLKQIALDDINKYRAQNGIHPLTLGNARSSQIYAEELLQEGCIHHIDSKGEGPMLRYKNNGDAMFLVSENIAGESGTLYGTPQSSILDGNNKMMYDDASSNWGHKRNMLDPQPESVSIGIAYDSQRLIMVQDFQAVLPSGYEYDPSSFQTEPEDQKFCW